MGVNVYIVKYSIFCTMQYVLQFTIHGAHICRHHVVTWDDVGNWQQCESYLKEARLSYRRRLTRARSVWTKPTVLLRQIGRMQSMFLWIDVKMLTQVELQVTKIQLNMEVKYI